MSSSYDIRVVVGVDFGTTYSGFAYAHKSNPNDVQVYDYGKSHHRGWFKTPTVINYDDSCTNVMSWGLSALATKPRGSSLRPSKPIELFKLHLLKRGTTSLPDALNYKDVIKDYLKELGKDIRRRVKSHWYSLDFDSQVIIVITVPAEFDDNAIETMSECAIGANLVKEENIERNLKFTTEPEAAAINSISSLRNENHLKSRDLFMVVDCGGVTVDLTTRELLDEDKLSEITVRAGDNCGSCYVDQAFIDFLGSKIGSSTIDILKENHYVNLQYYEYEPIKKCITGEEKEKLEADEWLIEAKFDDVKEMFDSVIERIFTLIRGQLEQLKRLKKEISLMLLVGGFSESEYLQDRIRGEFSSEVPNISVPKNPVTSVMKGAVKYGLSEEVIESRVLNWTYGTCIVRKWLPTDPLSYKLPNGYVKVFEKFGEEGYGASVKLNNAKYIGDPEIKLLRKFQLELPELDSYEDIEDITISFILKFGRVRMSAIAENKNTGHECKVTFKYDFDLV
ncbi:unnamed protein product [Rhizophagus irregularis]|nr:unnamed protein product [Rhizophagus irregularis]